jgi:hypothetical protein
MEWVTAVAGASAWYNQGTLAAAYAENGQFEEATKWGTRAMELAAGADEGRWQKWLAGFRERQPVREGVRAKEESTT